MKKFTALFILTSTLLSFKSFAVLTVIPQLPMSKEAKQSYLHCMDKAQDAQEREQCGEQYVKRLLSERNATNE